MVGRQKEREEEKGQMRTDLGAPRRRNQIIRIKIYSANSLFHTCAYLQITFQFYTRSFVTLKKPSEFYIASLIK